MKRLAWKKGVSAALTAALLLTAAVPAYAADAGKEKPAGTVYQDLAAKHWAAAAFERWTSEGVIQGYGDGSVRPEHRMSRAEFAVMMGAVFGFGTSLGETIADNPPDAWYAKDVSAAVAAGYLRLDADGHARPDAPMRRIDAAEALAALFGLEPSDRAPVFTDVSALTSSQLRAVNALASSGYLKGYPDGSFQPERTMSRAELVSLLDRMIAGYAAKPGETSLGTVRGNLVVDAADVTIKDTAVEGNVYLTPGIGDGNVTLKGVSVSGKTYVRGGGEHSVGLVDSTLGDVVVDKADGKVRVFASGSTSVANVRLVSGAKLEETDGSGEGFRTVTLPDSDAAVELVGSFGMIAAPAASGDRKPTLTIRGTVEELKLDGPAAIILEEGAVVKKLTASEGAGDIVIEGKGKIDTVENKSPGLKLNGETVPVGNTNGSGIGNGNTGNAGGGNVDSPTWTLTFASEFDSAADLEKWTPEIGTGEGGWGNNEQQYYTDQNATVEAGKLVITAKKEQIGSSAYTSSRLVTRDTFSQRYGKFEARIKLPAGTGFWPAFWMMPQDSAYGVWAASGEIDIMENKGRLPDTVSGAIHYGGTYPDNVFTGKEYKFPNGGTVEDYHTYAVEWEPGEIRWYVDGVRYQTQNNWYSVSRYQPADNAYPAPFDQPFYMILNLALGGNFDGGRPIDESLLPGKMYVDYVRAYELTGRPYRTPTLGDVAKDPIPDDAQPALPDGNLLYNSGLDQDSGSVPNLTYKNGSDTATSVANTDYWSLFEGEGGAGKVSVDTIGGTNYAKTEIANAGSQPYSVQLLNTASLVKGRYYKVSFDAKSTDARSMAVRMTGGESRGFAAYSRSQTVKLTDAFNHYEYQFQMLADTDVAARTEFNMGLNAQTVWIGNVRVEEIDGIQFNDDAAKEPLDGDGNRVYNGSFDQGRMDRMTFWHVETSGGADALAGVSESERYLRVHVTNPGDGSVAGVRVQQRGISLSEGQQYALSFRAASVYAPRDIEVALTNADGSATYYSETVTLDAADLAADGAMKTLSFTMEDPTDSAAVLVFRMGGPTGTILLDAVKLVQTSIVYPPDVDFYPLDNGGFDASLALWRAAVDTGGNIAAAWDQGEAKLSVAELGSNPWSNMFMQESMTLFKGLTYELSFDARATAPRKMQVDLEDSTYTRYFDKTVDLTAENQHFSYTFTMSSDVTAAIKFFLGNIPGQSIAGAHDVYVDNVALQIQGAPVARAPRLFADASQNVQGQAIDVTFQDDAAWRGKIASVSVDGTALDDAKYTVTAGNLHLAADVFPADGPYAIAVAAEGYETAKVRQIVLTSGGNLLANGTFDTGVDGWSTYFADGSDAAVSASGGAMQVAFGSYDGWNPWSTQVYQSGIALEAGKDYVLSFDASATAAKDILVSIENAADFNVKYLNTRTVGLTADIKSYAFTFTAGANDPDAKLVIQMGSNNATGPHYNGETISLDNFTLKRAMLTNGSFDANAATGWGTYTADGSDAAVSAPGGAMQVSFGSYDGWNPWSTQVYQENLTLKAGQTYVLSFDASASAAKDMLVSVERTGDFTVQYLPAQTVSLTGTTQTAAYEIQVAADEANAKLIFQLGSNNAEGPHFAGESVTIDNVILREKN